MSTSYSSSSTTDPLKPTRRTAHPSSSSTNPPSNLSSTPQYPTSQTLLTTPSSTQNPSIPPSIVFKLILFTILMITLPISTYFVTRATVFADMKSGNGGTWAGGAAALVANAVLVGYIVVAVLEDQGEDGEGGGKGKKGQ